MKRWIKVCLVLLIMIPMLLLGVKTDAGKQKELSVHDDRQLTDFAPTIFYDLTDIPLDKTVMFVGPEEVSTELYFYWLCYVCGSLENNILNDYNNYGLHGSCVDKTSGTVDWSSDYSGMPLMDYARTQVEETIKYYLSIEQLADELNVELTSSDLVDMENSFQAVVSESGGQDAFLDYLEILGIRKSTFDRISSTSYLYNNLLSLVLTKDSEIYLPEEEYDQFAAFADHILISNQNMQTGERLTTQEIMEKYVLAQSLMEQLADSSDPVKLFVELADEYSEDPIREKNPDGFFFMYGTMIPEFESAVRLLEPGEISEIIQSDYGFHIILRKDLSTILAEDESKERTIASGYLDELLIERTSNISVTYDECLDNVSWLLFYQDYISRVDEIIAMQAKSAD